ncbi:hypothetical protein BCR41DRAFT_399855 [Lobosporangium transversale]|uniref:F-box domain-containing protein n=1 Tax=Lobosporangium transversale TaxID=64571 RepID=A0A1Y2GES0_9FUNG|nr:hypothetical protein BCR41DRAFT_399855 [Lobosporangium transversale]ORZ06996.1 hypothetical protein BCR41DRAFT_399855 [Lobosporangium transversale]|eukprot:XP_021877792.1 hypothetical protein BCR41DRAFT_399855 [Lobosporangium transversale]
MSVGAHMNLLLPGFGFLEISFMHYQKTSVHVTLMMWYESVSLSLLTTIPAILDNFDIFSHLHFDFRTNGGEPDSKAVHKHNEYIEEITFESYKFNNSFPERHESLQRLQSIAYTWWCSWPTPTRLINQIKAHSSIITSFHATECIEYPPELWKELRHLELDHVTIHQLPVNILTRSCPALCSLDIKGHSRDEGDFYKVALLQHPWTLNNLSDLRAYITIEGEDIATLLRRMSELKWLCLPKCKFGQLSLQELLADKQEVMDNGQLVRKTRLWRLCETVETLVFVINSGIGGQTILSKCPRLKILDGFVITVSEIVDGTEWVCTRLTRLNIYLEADIDQETEGGMAKARIAFRQLGKLTRLESLDLTGWDPRSLDRRRLDMRLRAGLDELANLKRLNWLSFRFDRCQRI